MRSLAIANYEKMVIDRSIYPGANIMMHRDGITYTALALAGEGGEVANLWKKNLRDPSKAIPVMQLADELGDVLFYITALARHLGMTLEDIMALNTEKLDARSAAGTLAHRAPGDR